MVRLSLETTTSAQHKVDCGAWFRYRNIRSSKHARSSVLFDYQTVYRWKSIKAFGWFGHKTALSGAYDAGAVRINVFWIWLCCAGRNSIGRSGMA
jgi:hypothetical protein